jgi:hypothetical protein
MNRATDKSSTVKAPVTAMKALKDFTSDRDGHYDLDGVTFVGGQILVASGHHGHDEDRLLAADEAFFEDEEDEETLEERAREHSHL